MKKSNLLIIAMLASGLLGTAVAQDKSGYAVSADGSFVRNGDGTCMRSGSWTPTIAIQGCEAAAAVVAPKSAVAAATVAAPMTTSLASENLFAFGQSTLQAAAVADLDVLVAKLKGAKVQKIAVTGHTDRLGSAALNKALAQKRAAAVRKYLISKGIDKSLIQAVGVGSAQPKTAASACTGTSANPELIACLAADRRVEIKVSFR
jgi:OOP family OmpA-OmpF porin